MERLRRQADNVTIMVWAAMAAAYCATFVALPLFQEWVKAISLFGFSWTVLPIGCLYLYRTSGWKYLNPDLYLEGRWEFTETHFIVNSKGMLEFDFQARGWMTVTQDTQSISIRGTTYKDMGPDTREEHLISVWWSITCGLQEGDPHIAAVLDHDNKWARKDIVKYGVEIFTRVERLNDTEVPIVPMHMASTVYHTRREGREHIVYVNYKRVPTPVIGKIVKFNHLASLR